MSSYICTYTLCKRIAIDVHELEDFKMVRKVESFLTASVETQPFTVRIDMALREQLRLLDERIAKEAPRLAFDRAQVVQAALERAVETANAELDALAGSRRSLPA
jgi:hypothetical protein